MLRPLLALASEHLEFYILALKLNDTRYLQMHGCRLI